MRPAHRPSFRPPSTSLAVGVLAAWILSVTPGCGLPATTRSSASSSDRNADSGLQSTPRPVITLGVSNTTEAAVRAELYVTTNALSNTVDTLFTARNLFTERLGLAASGLLAPGEADLIEIDCDEAIVIGTSGGVFVNPDTGEWVGTGLPRILEQGLVFDCGARIALVYGREDARFSVDVTLQ